MEEPRGLADDFLSDTANFAKNILFYIILDLFAENNGYLP